MTLLYADTISRLHETGPGHPESPARFDAALRGLAQWPLTSFTRREASWEEIALAHDPDYLRIVQRDVQAGLSQLSTGDTAIAKLSFQVAARAAGTVLTAVDEVFEAAGRNAFCVVRPPGHHASEKRGMGFCIFNNVAIGARYAQRKFGISRVLIADWDVHHGNGTQDIFYEDPSVFFFSTHQSPWYPGTGEASERGAGPGRGSTLNCPFLAGSGRDEIVGAFQTKLVPAMEEFRPELVIISAGFDSRIGDPLGKFRLADADFADLTSILMGIADRHAEGRIVSVLEGGYSLSGLAAAVSAHVSALQRDSRQRNIIAGC